MVKVISFPYIGGKSFLMGRILEIVPPHKIWLEPFCGAASVTLNKPPSQLEVINDINKDIHEFFIAIRDRYDELYNYLVNTPYSRALYYESVHKWKQGWRPEKHIEKVALWYFLQAASFSGKFEGGFSTGKFKNQAIPFVNRVDELCQVRDRLREVFIESRDYQEVIEYYDNEYCLIYCDPPYMIDAADEYYKAGPKFDHYRLSEVLNKVKGKVILSYYPHPDLEKLYPEPKWKTEYFDMAKFSFGANVGGCDVDERPIGRELLLYNFENLPLFRELK